MPANSRSAPSFLRRNGLSVVFLALFALTLAGHLFTGWHFNTADRAGHGQAPQALLEYVRSGEFLSSVFENWESEFLQMGLFVLLTVWLRQKGSSESRGLEPADEPSPTRPPRSQQPWPVRRGGIWLKLYQHSLSGSLLLLFAISLVAHWLNSWRQHSHEQLLHGQSVTPLLDYLWNAQFWFESFQNWQSEFLSVVVLVVLSIFLREKDSPQSKPVQARNSDTGTS